VSGAKIKGRGGGAGPAGLRCWANWAVCARVREEEKASGLLACGLKEEKGREREGEGKGFFFLLNFLFKFIFQTFKLQSNKIHAFES
jgi:hypothetical protein